MNTEDWIKFMDNVEITEDGHWIWLGVQNPGNKYGQMKLNGRKRTCHSIILEEVLGRPIQKGKLTRHLCKEKLCCSPDHLKEGTPAENALDKIRDGTMLSKLTAQDVRNIRADTRYFKEIAETYNVTKHHIGLIKNRKSWKWLD